MVYFILLLFKLFFCASRALDEIPAYRPASRSVATSTEKKVRWAKGLVNGLLKKPSWLRWSAGMVPRCSPQIAESTGTRPSLSPSAPGYADC